MNLLLLIIIFVMGACFGSFVNMLIYRTARKYKLEKSQFLISKKNKNRSFCDYCGRQLKWYENVPIISWVIQKGKTRCCRKKLPISYPIIEILMGSLFVIYELKFVIYEYNLIAWILGLIIVVFLIFSALFDLKYMELPDFSTLILAIIAFLGVVFDERNIIPYLLSAIGCAGFLLILFLITKGNGMGFGDVKLAVFMGLFLGWPKIILAVYVAFIVGAVVGIIMMILKKANKKTAIPFGPFLILGTVTAWWLGDYVLNLFYKWL